MSNIYKALTLYQEMYKVLYIHQFTESLETTVKDSISLILQLKNLKLREVKCLFQSHIQW